VAINNQKKYVRIDLKAALLDFGIEKALKWKDTDRGSRNIVNKALKVFLKEGAST
jgi:DNA replication protein DnaD